MPTAPRRGRRSTPPRPRWNGLTRRRHGRGPAGRQDRNLDVGGLQPVQQAGRVQRDRAPVAPVAVVGGVDDDPQREVAALGDYAVVRAPFAGIVTQRLVDPGAFAAPGTPLIALQDDSRLRISVAVPPTQVQNVRRGMTLNATIEGRDTSATVEGVFPTGQGGELFTVNALVPNQRGSLPSGGAAVLLIPAGKRSAVLVPEAAVRREGSLTGVVVTHGATDAVRWVRLGPADSGFVEILAGLRAGDTIRVPRAGAR